MSEEIIYPIYVLCMLSDVPGIVECAEKTYIQAGYIRLSRWARSDRWLQSEAEQVDITNMLPIN
ncbi:hypothetical protein [Anaplasma phagocytophilum]|uniref:Uncharacterized protein n=2 Tax=Anaplasma phagocytophilum TaxID=948 RepID=A0A0F3Q6M6_ANAPH|nr:hypothetical protein [Anaplasma phagocytophilum]EOA63042.1 hypothetical protein CRT38_01045 [Anaplasma phagocytophilum str. CRT38]KDB57506.1 hypothetical protein P030_02365 [Anaplasma phagocytophilum str. CRT35]KJV87831.1 hypothetical protein APHCRT_0284 [Anaplasma phagocytophilum str. CRT53-1]